jgi:hypothetical protein
MSAWSAVITEKSSLDTGGLITVSFSILRDEEAILENVSAYGAPESIQQIIEEKVKEFAPRWELAQEIQVGQKLDIIL